MSLEANTVLENLVRGSEVTSDSQFSTRVCNNAPEDDEQAAVVLERLGSITFQGVCDGSRKRTEALSPHSDYHDSIHRLNWALDFHSALEGQWGALGRCRWGQVADNRKLTSNLDLDWRIKEALI